MIDTKKMKPATGEVLNTPHGQRLVEDLSSINPTYKDRFGDLLVIGNSALVANGLDFAQPPKVTEVLADFPNLERTEKLRQPPFMATLNGRDYLFTASVFGSYMQPRTLVDYAQSESYVETSDTGNGVSFQDRSEAVKYIATENRPSDYPLLQRIFREPISVKYQHLEAYSDAPALPNTLPINLFDVDQRFGGLNQPTIVGASALRLHGILPDRNIQQYNIVVESDSMPKKPGSDDVVIPKIRYKDDQRTLAIISKSHYYPTTKLASLADFGEIIDDNGLRIQSAKNAITDLIFCRNQPKDSAEITYDLSCLRWLLSQPQLKIAFNSDL